MVTFEEAAEKAKSFSKTVPSEVFLEFYSLYKQATVGDNSTPEPTNEEERFRWLTWKGLEGTSAEEAKALYVQAYNRYAPLYQ